MDISKVDTTWTAEVKSPKECCVESIMHDIDELGNGKQVRSLRGAIEQQVRRAWNGGYCNGYREGSEDREEVSSGINWFMMQTVAEYSADELQAAFGYDHLADAIEHLTYNEFYDMYEDYEDRKREEAKKIHVGDEITWEQIFFGTGTALSCRGIVTGISDHSYNVLIMTRLGSFTHRLIPIHTPTIKKTGQHFDEFKGGDK